MKASLDANGFKASGLNLNKKKCAFGISEIKYVGHIFPDKGLRVDPAEVEAVQKMPVPKNGQELHRLLGMVSYL